MASVASPVDAAERDAGVQAGGGLGAGGNGGGEGRAPAMGLKVRWCFVEDLLRLVQTGFCVGIEAGSSQNKRIASPANAACGIHYLI